MNKYKVVPALGLSLLFSGAASAASIDAFTTDQQGNVFGAQVFGASENGRIAFMNGPNDLDPAHAGATYPLYVKDLVRGTYKDVHINSNGQAANGASSSAKLISGNGQVVVFDSVANNLDARDTNGDLHRGDLFVHNIATGNTSLITIGLNGQAVPTGGSPVVSHGLRDISYDGRYVLFTSNSPLLVENDTNGSMDLFVADLEKEEIKRVNLDLNGNATYAATGTISSNGRYVFYYSTTQYKSFVHDLETSTVSVFESPTGLTNCKPSDIDYNGRYAIATCGGVVHNGSGVYRSYLLIDRTGADSWKIINQREDGTLFGSQYGEAAPFTGMRLSHDGRYVAYTSTYNDLVAGDSNYNTDVFVWDSENNGVVRATEGLENRLTSYSHAITKFSRDDRYVYLQGSLDGVNTGFRIDLNDTTCSQ